MKNGLQYPVSSAICYLVDYPLSSVKCSVGQCFWSTGQDKDLLVFFCVPEVAYHIHPLLYTQTYTGLSYTPTHTLGCSIHPHHTRRELSYTPTLILGCPIHPQHTRNDLPYTPTHTLSQRWDVPKTPHHSKSELS